MFIFRGCFNRARAAALWACGRVIKSKALDSILMNVVKIINLCYWIAARIVSGEQTERAPRWIDGRPP